MIKTKNWLKNNRSKLFIAGIFAILFGLISFVNHYLFRTYALDLGLYTNALYKFSHFTRPESTMIHDFNEHILGGHFSLYYILFSPFIWIFGSYTLLILQCAFIILGGVGVHKYVATFINPRLAPYSMVFFFAFFGVFSAVAYDYHHNVVAASMLPWFFYHLKSRHLKTALLLFLFILFGQENMAIWLFFVCLGLLLHFRKDHYFRKILAIFAGFSVLYFVLVMELVIPAFSATENYRGFEYKVLGSNYREALINLLTHPIANFKLLFTNHLGPEFNYVKAEFLVILAISGLLFLIRKPYYLLMLLPLFAQKLFHDKTPMWSIAYHYSIEFAPILAIAVFDVINSIKNKKGYKIALVFAMIGVFTGTIRVMDNTICYFEKARIRFYQAQHYQRDYDVKRVHEMLHSIPKDAGVSAQSSFVPHLALREEIYQFPIIRKAEYIVLSEKEPPYPLEKESLLVVIDTLKTSRHWTLQSKSEGLYIFKRN